MLRIVKLNFARPSARAITPALLEPLLRAVEVGADLVPIARGIVRKLGFDSFLCGWSSASRPDRDALLYVFTTLPAEWTTIYDRKHYVEVDPRIQFAEDINALFAWSAAELRGKRRELDEFLNDAETYGVRSGACFAYRDPIGNAVLIGYNSSRERVDPESLKDNADVLYSFGHAFHDVFMRSVVQSGIPSRLHGVSLTPREIEALQYAARGLTIQDIAPKMCISPRTVRYHIESATTKLGALKREEAIALAAKGGLLNLPP
jgi:LuxR family quorum sensing-dependent transcriptional regulator